MNKRNEIQEVNESPFEKYQEEINYDIILEGTIPYDITGIEDSPEPAPEQIQDGEEQIFKQLESDMSNEDYLYEAFEDTGIARGRIYGEFSDKDVDESKLYFKLGISKQDATKELDTNEIKEYFEGFLENLDINTDSVSVTGWKNEEEDVEPTYVSLKITGKPNVNILKTYTEEKELDVSNIDRKLVMEGTLDFIKENNIKSITLNDDGIMELYENNKLVDTKPFSKLGIQRECKSIIQEGYIIKNEDTNIDVQNIDEADLEQTKQNIEQSMEKVDEIQDLKDQLQDKVDNLYNESKIEEEKIMSFVSTPFTQQLLSTEEIYNLKLEEELTVEQVAYITKLFGSLEEFKNSLIQLTDIASMPPQIHFISIDEYIKEMEKEFDKEGK